MLMMMRSNQSKVTPPPPVPPRPSKTIVAEALAKSRRLSPIRVLYATQPLSALDVSKQQITNGKHIPNGKEIPKENGAPISQHDPPNPKPVVPIRTAPPPPNIKPKPNGHIAQVVKSYSSAMVFNQKLRNIEDANRLIRSASDVGNDIGNNKTRTVVYQSSNVKTSKIEVTLDRKPSIKTGNVLKRVESTKNERNKQSNGDKQMIKITPPVPDNKTPDPVINTDNKQHFVKINTAISSNQENSIKNIVNIKESTPKQSPDSSLDLSLEKSDTEIPNSSESIRNTDILDNNLSPADQIIDIIVQSNEKALNLSETIVQSSDKTTIIFGNKTDDANNNIFLKNGLSKEDQNSDSEKDKDSRESTVERSDNKKVQFDDKVNHEILIAELQSMREEQDRLLKRQRKAPVDIYDCDNESVNSDSSRIQHSDWIEVANNGEEVRLSSCQIYIDNPSDESIKSSSYLSSRTPQRAPSMSSLHGLPPLPKSLSGFNLLENSTPVSHRIETPRGSYRVPASPGPQTPSRAGSSRGTTPPTPGSGSGHVVYPPHPRVNGTAEVPRGRKLTTLDTQLAILRREMYGLRQLDLSLLSQLYSLNEAIQDFRQILQDQEDSALSPHSPSPSPSSGDEGDEFYSPVPVRFKPAPPAPPLRRTSNSSSANSSEYGTV